MGLGTNYLSNTTSTSVGYFVPEIWSDDVVASYKAATVMANLVRKISFAGKRGDTIFLPNPTRNTATDKTVGSQVTLTDVATAQIAVVVDQWKQYSVQVDDIIALQSLPSMRRFITDDAGYAVARAVDQKLHTLSAYWQSGTNSAAALYETAFIGGDGTTAFSGAANTNTGNGSAITDAGIRSAIQTLDDQNTPGQDRFLVIPPVAKKTLLGLSRFTEQAFVGNGNAIMTGRVGNVYGVEIYVSTDCPWIHVNSVTGTQSGDFSSTSPTSSAYVDAYGNTVNWSSSSPTDTKYRVASLFQREANVMAEQQSIRSQAQYKQEYLAWLYTTDTIFGVKNVRTTSGVALIVPA